MSLLLLFPSSAGQQYTLEVDPGAFAVTGTNASLRVGHGVFGQVGAFAVTGTAATLKEGHKVVPAAGSFLVSGTSATLTEGHTVVPAVGAFLVSGTPATMRVGYQVIPASTTFAVSGTNAALRIGRGVFGQVGAFAVSGQDVTFAVTRTLTADAGAFGVSGTAADLVYTPVGAYVLAPASGSFLLNGQAATLEVSGIAPPVVPFGRWRGVREPEIPHHYSLVARSGSFALTGTPAMLHKGYQMAGVDAGAAIASEAADLSVQRRLRLASGAFTVDASAGPRALRRLDVAAGAFGLHGDPAQLRIGQDVARAWLALQQERDDIDDLVLLGVFDR